MPAGDRVIDFLEKSGRPKRRVLEQIRGRKHRRSRYSALLQLASELVAVALRRPLGDVLVQHSAVLEAPERSCKALLCSPYGRTHGIEQRAPLLLVLNANRYPAILAAGRECAVRSRRRIVTGGARARVPGQVELEQRVGDVLHARFQLRDINVPAFAGGTCVVNCCERAECGEVAGERIGHADAMNQRSFAGITADARDSRERFAYGGKRNVVAPRTVLTEAGDGRYDNRGLHLPQRLVGETEL